jgi:hypothetical protein
MTSLKFKRYVRGGKPKLGHVIEPAALLYRDAQRRGTPGAAPGPPGLAGPEPRSDRLPPRVGVRSGAASRRSQSGPVAAVSPPPAPEHRKRPEARQWPPLPAL